MIEERKARLEQIGKEMEDIATKGMVTSQNSFGEVQANIAKSKIDSEMGMATGIAKNLEQNSAMYVQNAQYSEMQRQQTADAKIQTQGGIDKAVSVDTREAAQKAAQQMGAVQGIDDAAERIKRSGENISDVLERIARDLQNKKISGDAQSIEMAKSVAKFFEDSGQIPKGLIKSEQDAMALLGKLQAGNISGVVSPDGTATYSFRGNGKHIEISDRKTGRDEDIEGKFWEFVSDTVGESNFETVAEAGLAAAGGYLLQKKMGNPVGKIWKKIDPFDKLRKKKSPEHLNSNSNNSSGNNPTNSSNNTQSEKSADTHRKPPFIESNSSITNSGNHFKTPAGFVERESGLVVPESVEKNIAKDLAKETAQTGAKSFLKKIPLIGLLASMAFAGERAMEGDFTGAGLELASGVAGTLPGIGTAASLGIDGLLMARDAGVIGGAFTQTTGMSLTAASAIHNPITPQDVNQSFQTQIQGFYQQEAIKRSVENMEQFKAFTHPDAPVPGITLQTQAGEIGFSKTYDGYLTIGGRETAIPYSDFQQQMSANDGYMATQIANAISQSQISQNNIEQMLPNVGNMRTTEELLMSIRQTSSAQSMDTRIGTSELIEQASVNTEIMEEMADALNKMKEKMGAD